MEPLFFLAFLGVMAVVAVMAIKNKQAQTQAWQAFAREHGLRLHQAGTWGNPRMEGRYRGLDVTLAIEVHGSGKHRKVYTRALARFPVAMPRGLNITSEGFTDRLAKLMGGQDIRIGHAELDSKLRIRGEDEAAVRTLMGNWRARNAIAAFVARDGTATVTQHQCTVLRRGFQSQPSELRGMLESVCRTVTEVQRGLEGGPAADPAPSQEVSTSEPPPVTRFAWEVAAGSPARAIEDLLESQQPGVTVHTHTTSVVEVTTLGLDGAETTREVWTRDGVTGEGAGAVVALAPGAVKPPHLPSSTARPDGVEVTPVMRAASEPPQARVSGEPLPGAMVTLEELLALEGRSVSSTEQRSRTAALVGRPLALELEVERVSLTMGMGVPRALEGGRTVVGHPVGHSGLRLAVRFPEHASAVPGALGYGDTLALRGVIVSWDEFYRQFVVDAS